MTVNNTKAAKPGEQVKHEPLTGERLSKWQEEQDLYLAKIKEQERLYRYRDKRKSEYPSIEDQLDKLYHEGLEGWKASIQEVKDKHPKPSE